MKKPIILLALICSVSLITAQIKVPMILDTIWVKDAIGNIDSVIIGADSAATTQIDPEFGEIQLTHPFDSVFEIRTMSFFSVNRELAKKNIDRAHKIRNSSNSCWRGDLYAIMIFAKHQPVTIYWNRQHFENTTCKNGSFITNHFSDLWVQSFNWDRDSIKKCMAFEDSLVIDTSIPSHLNTDFKIEGKGKQSIYGVRIDIAPWCPIGIIGSADDTDNSDSNLKIFPNPVNDILNIKGEFAKSANVYNLQGKLILKSADTSKIDVSQLASGIYFLDIFDKNRFRQVSKFIKM